MVNIMSYTIQQIVLIWCLASVLCLCSVYAEDRLEIQKVCVKVKNNTNCEWTDKTVSYDIHQQKYGIVYIKMPMLTTCYNSSYFTIRLHVADDIISPEKCNLDSENYNWKLHSEIMVDRNCDKYVNNNIPIIKFRYVFTGCYKIVIKLRSFPTDVSDPVFISTDYKKKTLNDPGTINVTFTPIRRGELDVIITISSSDVNKPPNIRTLLEETADINKNLKGDLIIKCNKEEEEDGCKTFSQSFKVNESFPNRTFNCTYSTEYHNNVRYICKYKGLNSGQYAFRYQWLDEYTRCQIGTIWVPDDFHGGCDARYTTDVPELNDTLVIYTRPTERIYYYIPIMIILLLFASCVLVYGYGRIRNKYWQNSPTQSPLLDKLIEVTRVCDKQEILLIWSRDLKHTNQFFDIINNLKKLLQGQNISILDINEINEEISTHQLDWIISKIENPKLKVILFLNIWSICLYVKHPSRTYENEECQDKLFKPAIIQLRNSRNRCRENFFVLQLNSFPSDDTIFSCLHAERRYIMPNDIQKLLTVFPLCDQGLDHQERLLNDFRASCSRYEPLSGSSLE